MIPHRGGHRPLFLTCNYVPWPTGSVLFRAFGHAEGGHLNFLSDQNHYEEVLAPGPLGPPQTTSLIQQHLKQQPPNITTKSWGAANVHQQSQLTRDPETSTMAALLDHSTFVPSLREDRKKKHSVNHNLVMILSN